MCTHCSIWCSRWNQHGQQQNSNQKPNKIIILLLKKLILSKADLCFTDLSQTAAAFWLFATNKQKTTREHKQVLTVKCRQTSTVVGSEKQDQPVRILWQFALSLSEICQNTSFTLTCARARAHTHTHTQLKHKIMNKTSFLKTMGEKTKTKKQVACCVLE